MAFIQDVNNSGTRAYSIGPVKQMIISGTVASGDTSITISFPSLAECRFALLSGVLQSAAPTYSGNSATFTIVDPVATRWVSACAHGV